MSFPRVVMLALHRDCFVSLLKVPSAEAIEETNT
jgi:hypothetical protein